MGIDIQLLVRILDRAGKILLPYFGKTKILSSKDHRDILHQADLESNRFITVELNKHYQTIQILSEESNAASLHNKARGHTRFILDPLDGTINFSRGIDEFGISLAFENKSQREIGLVYKPVKKMLYKGVRNAGSYLNGKRLKVSSTARLEESIIAFDFAREEQRIPSYMQVVQNEVRALRSYGCAIQTLGYVCEGKIDGYVFTQPKIWDIAAMEVIIKEAGGFVSDHKGNYWEAGKPLLVSNLKLKRQLLQILSP